MRNNYDRRNCYDDTCYHYRQCCRYLLLETGQKRKKDSQGTISLADTLQKRTGFIACPFCLQKIFPLMPQPARPAAPSGSGSRVRVLCIIE